MQVGDGSGLDNGGSGGGEKQLNSEFNLKLE